MSAVWVRRMRCHRSIVCCQYVDLPMCNSSHDTHWLGRMVWRRWARAERDGQTEDEVLGRLPLDERMRNGL